MVVDLTRAGDPLMGTVTPFALTSSSGFPKTRSFSRRASFSVERVLILLVSRLRDESMFLLSLSSDSSLAVTRASSFSFLVSSPRVSGPDRVAESRAERSDAIWLLNRDESLDFAIRSAWSLALTSATWSVSSTIRCSASRRAPRSRFSCAPRLRSVPTPRSSRSCSWSTTSRSSSRFIRSYSIPPSVERATSVSKSRPPTDASVKNTDSETDADRTSRESSDSIDPRRECAARDPPPINRLPIPLRPLDPTLALLAEEEDSAFTSASSSAIRASARAWARSIRSRSASDTPPAEPDDLASDACDLPILSPLRSTFASRSAFLSSSSDVYSRSAFNSSSSVRFVFSSLLIFARALPRTCVCV